MCFIVIHLNIVKKELLDLKNCLFRDDDGEFGIVLGVFKRYDGKTSGICRDKVDAVFFYIYQSAVEFEFGVVVIYSGCDLFKCIDELV